MAGMMNPIPGLLSTIGQWYDRNDIGTKLVGGGVRGAATRGLLGMESPRDATAVQREVYENAARAAAPALGAASLAMTMPAKVVKAAKAKSLLDNAPQSQALETARKNAVTMLGLPENNTAMDRALAMGFDRDVYHGASKTPEKRLYEDGVYLGTEEPQLRDLTEFKAGGGRGEGGALFGSDMTQIANGYAIPNRAQAGAVYPLKARSSDFVEAGFTKPYPINGTASEQDAWMREAEAFNRSLDRRKNRYFSSTIKENPGKSVVFKNTEDAAADIGSVPMSDIYAMTGGPIRSRFAAFDPARINENNLLASVAAGGVSIPLFMGLLDRPAED